MSVLLSAWRGSGFRGEVWRLWPGLLFSAVVAGASTFIADTRGGPTLLYALLLGMALNSVASDEPARPGIDFAARHILRIGVALLGARITFEQVAAVGWVTGLLLIGGVVATIVFGIVAAKALGLSRQLGVLTGGATAICGASAAMAIASVLARDEKAERELIFTIAGVTALSTAAMVLYPMVVKWLALDARSAGMFLGGTIHDVAQVVGAGYSLSPEVGDFAVLTKLMRVAMLLPVVATIAVVVRRRAQGPATREGERPLPTFLLAFVAFVVVGSVGLIPKPVGVALNDIARGCLVVAIAAVGLKTSPLEMKRVGARAFVLLAAETAFLAALVLAGNVMAR